MEASTMKFSIVDVFTDRVFGGNPAGVVMIPEGQEESYAAWGDDSSGKGSAPSAYDYNEAIALSNGWRTAG